MAKNQWRRAPGCESSACPEVWFKGCGESSHCPEVHFSEHEVLVRDSERPDEVVRLSKQGWKDLLTIQAPEGW